jgi:flagellar biosynthesis protein FlhF
MQLRTFRGKSMAEALTAVKRELGPDALIVHTRSFKVGGVLGVGAKEEVEILASPMGPAPTPPPRTRPINPPTIENRLRAAYAAPRPEPGAEPAPAQPTLVLHRSEPPESTRQPRLPLASPSAPPAPARAVAPPSISRTSRPDLHDEIGAIKEMVSKLLSSGSAPSLAPQPPSASADPLADWYLRLLANAVSRDLADRIIADARRRLSAGAPDEAAIRDAFRECIASHIRTAPHPPHLPAPSDPRPRAIALVGATGVGKTTTIAKLAAQAKLNQSGGNAAVGLITCDTNRIGAIEQLRTYADIVGAAFHVAGTPVEMREARRSLSACDLVLIDTPGLSPRDAAAIESLRATLDAADLTEVHLALPASGSEPSLLAACRAFAPLGPSRLLFTKMDEAVTYGVILSVASHVRAELSYLTSGPRIPEQIELPDPYRLADLIAAA